jgi:DNA-binding CsgD family transcriptional regulator
MPSYVSREAFDARSYAVRELGNINVDVGAEPAVARRLRKIVSFDTCTFSGLDIEGCEFGAGVYLTSSLPEVVTQTYSREKYLEIDPLARLLTQDKPIATSEEIESGAFNTPKARKLFELLRDHNATNRTVFTLWSRGRIYGAAMLTRQKAFTSDELKSLELFVPIVHTSLARPIVDAMNARLGLSKGEILCLRLAAEGLSSEEIAADTPYTVETVTTYLKSATKKLGTRNRPHAIAEALRRKIIA